MMYQLFTQSEAKVSFKSSYASKILEVCCDKRPWLFLSIEMRWETKRLLPMTDEEQSFVAEAAAFKIYGIK